MEVITIYKCDCVARGDNISPYCPMHGMIAVDYYNAAEADAEIKRLKYKLRELSNIAHATHKKSDYYDMIENLKLIEHEANILSL